MAARVAALWLSRVHSSRNAPGQVSTLRALVFSALKYSSLTTPILCSCCRLAPLRPLGLVPALPASILRVTDGPLGPLLALALAQ